MQAGASILIVDPSPILRMRIEAVLTNATYVVEQADSLAAALTHLSRGIWAFVIAGYRVEDASGLALVDAVHAQSPSTGVILVGDQQQATALAALRGGASDYLPTPIDESELLAALSRYRPGGTADGGAPPHADSAPARPALSEPQRIAAELAHEINNPLTPIIGMAELLLEDLPPGHPGRDYAVTIKLAAWQIRDVVRRMRAGGSDMSPSSRPQHC